MGGIVMTSGIAMLATRPSAGRLASKDVAFLFLITGLVTPVVIMVVVLVLMGSDSGEDGYTIPMLIVLTVVDVAIGLGFYYVRWRFFSNFLTTAVEAYGEISEILVSGDQRSIVYRYSYLGKDYGVANKYGALSTRKNKLMKGDRITVLLNPDKPSESLILDIYV